MKKFTLLLFAALTMLCGKAGAQKDALDEITELPGIIPTGTYEIVFAKYDVNQDNFIATSKVWDVTNGIAQGEQRAIQLYERNNTNAQHFKISYKKNDDRTGLRVYNIQSFDGQYVEVPGDEWNEGVQLKQWGNASHASEFVIAPLRHGVYFIVHLRTQQQMNENKPYNLRVFSASTDPADKTSVQLNGNSTSTEFYQYGGWLLVPVPERDENFELKKPVISDGEYRIILGHAISGGLHTKGHLDTDEDKKVHYWTRSDFNNPNEKWDVKSVGNGYYTIKNKGQDKYLNVKGAPWIGNVTYDDNKGYTDLWVYSAGNEEKNKEEDGNLWMIKEHGNNFLIINKRGRFLDLRGDNGYDVPADGSVITTYMGNGTVAQDWKFVEGPGDPKFPEGLYTIKLAANTNFCFDVDNKNMDNSGNILLRNHSEDKKNQQFWIEPVTNDKNSIDYGYYSIYAHHSKRYLDMEGKDGHPYFQPGANLQQWGKLGDDFNNNRKWIIKSLENDIYTIINEGGLALDASGGIGGELNGKNVQGWTSQAGNLDNKAQQWKIEPCVIHKTISGFDYSTMYYGDLHLRLPDGVKALTLKFKDEKNNAVVANTSYHPGDIVPLTEAVVLKYTEGNNQAHEVVLSVVCDEKAGTLSKVVGNCLEGNNADSLVTVSDQDTNTYIYRLTNPTSDMAGEIPTGEPFGFYMMYPQTIKGVAYKPGKSIQSKAHLCYLKAAFNNGLLPYDEQNTMNEIPFFVSLEADDEETDIQALPEATNYKLQTTDEIYNLAGQRLLKMQKGINIVNGKKVMVK